MALAETFEAPVLRAVDEADAVCQDCFGTLVVEDDGSISGTPGALVDCICVELSVPPGFVECHACAALVPVGGGLSVRHDALVAEYLAFCTRAGMEPAWCLSCGAYRPLANGVRPPCDCGALTVRQHLGSVTVAGPWGVER